METLVLKKIVEDLQNFNHQYEPNGFKIVSLFGSYARETNDFFSDIDLTYSVDSEIFYKNNAFEALSKLEKIKKELEGKFHKKIDLIPSNTKNYLIKQQLQKEQIFI